MKNSYNDLIVHYLYDEANEDLKQQVEHLIQSDPKFKDLYNRLKESKQMLDAKTHTEKPSQSVIDRIMEYAASKEKTTSQEPGNKS